MFTVILFVAVIILGIVVFDMRARLAIVEKRLKDGASVPHRTAWQDMLPQPVTSRRASPVVVSDELAPPAPEPVEKEAVEEAAVEVAAAEPEELQPEPEPVLVSATSPVAARQGLGIRFEDLFGRQLPIWAGGITLAVAGVLLVKYSIDAGLLSPAVRVILGLLFGIGLIGGAEVALRAEQRVADPRIRQALSGAGIASLYAAILAASNLYHLIGPATAFVGLALVTASAMGLSIRFGAPSALLGLVGGLAAPALVGEGQPNIPLLSAYLALAIGGLTALSRQQRWMWLSVSALIGGAGWGGLLILTGALDFATSLSLGLLVLLLGLALPLIAFTGIRAALFRTAAAVVAAAQIALLVAKGGFEPLHWGLYLLLAAALGWLAWREERFRPLPPVGLAVGLLLTILWPQPPVGQFAAVMLLLAALHAGPALTRLWRQGSGMIEAGQIAAVVLAGHGIAWGRFPDADKGLLAMLALGAACLPAVGAFLGWARPERRADARFVTLCIAACLLLVDAAYLALPLWLLPVAMAMLTAGLVLLARAAEDRRVEYGALAFLAGSVVALLATDTVLDEAARLVGETGTASIPQALLRWAAVAGAAALSAWRITLRNRPGAEVVAAILAYGTAAQVAPGWALSVIAGIGIAVAVEGGRRLSDRALYPAAASFGVIALLWALEPLSDWLEPALLSLVGEPMMVTDLPSLTDAVTSLAIPAALALVALWRAGAIEHPRLRRAAYVVAGSIGLIAAHIVFKHLFQLGDDAAVVQRGFAERTLWEALLLGSACAVWKGRGMNRLALVGAGAALAHGLWYSLVLFDPLVTPVAVGSLPIANLLLPAFATFFGALWLVEDTVPTGRALLIRIAPVLRMILIVLFAYMTLRQLFSGSVLVGMPIGSVENIGWSVLAIALAIGFLLWGIRQGGHDWRIGSLVLMLAAVAKVFLLDAAGLEGLLRIVSFLALGFSLIGLGWLYSRFLRRDAV